MDETTNATGDNDSQTTTDQPGTEGAGMTRKELLKRLGLSEEGLALIEYMIGQGKELLPLARGPESTPERVRALIAIAKQEGVRELTVGDIRIKLPTSPDDVQKLMGMLKDFRDETKKGTRRTRARG